MSKTWYVIANPIAGNGNFTNKWKEIEQYLKLYNVSYKAAFTTHHKHEITLVHDAINKGFTHFISVGGDGTLHHMVNGIMTQRVINSNHIYVAVIPMGTGNDWIKTYDIPAAIKQCVELINSYYTIKQDIGFLQLKNTSCYFNNVAGIGYDGYVVNKLNKLKRFGSIAYLLSGLSGLLFYKKSKFSVHINNTTITSTVLMTLFGICKYSAGGMQLTKYKDSTNGTFDITIAKNLNIKDLILNIKQLYTGEIVHHKKVATYTTNQLLITPEDSEREIFIQADGELIGTGSVAVSIHPQAINFVVPKDYKSNHLLS